MARSITLLSPCTSFENRVDQVRMRFDSCHLQRGRFPYRVCFWATKCSSKLYCLVAARPFLTIPVDSVGLLAYGSKQRKCQASSGVSVPTDVQRSELYARVLFLFSSSGERRSNLVHGNSSDNFSGMKGFENELQDLFNEVKAMVKMGNKDDAVDLLQANYEAVKEQMDAGLKGIEQAAVLDVIALGYMSVGNLKLVKVLLDKINEIVDHLTDDEPLLDSILMHLASMYSSLRKFEKAILRYQRVVDILEGRYGKNSTLLVAPLLGMAKVLGSTGRATKAVDIYERTITILEMSKGAESEDLVMPLLALGKLLIKEGRATDAETAFVRILKIYCDLYGEKDGRTGMAMCSLAHAKCAIDFLSSTAVQERLTNVSCCNLLTGAVDEAIGLYRDALQLIKSSNYMSVDDNIMENMRIDLAELLHIVGRGKEGRELLEECLLVTERYKGKDHPSRVAHLLNLATSYSRTKNFVEAERLLRTCLDIMVKTVGPEDQSITFPMLQLAVTLYQLNRDEEAEQLALEVLRVRENAFGKDSLPVGETLDCLISIQARLGRDDADLLKLLNMVLKIQEKEFGYEGEEIMVTLQKIIFFLDKLGRKDEKLKLQRRLSLLKEKYKHIIRY